MATPKYVTWLWEKFGKKLQPAADQINAWKIPEWAKPIIVKAEQALVSAGSMVWMKKFAVETCKKFDDEYAKALIEAVLRVFKRNEK